MKRLLPDSLIYKLNTVKLLLRAQENLQIYFFVAFDFYDDVKKLLLSTKKQMKKQESIAEKIATKRTCNIAPEERCNALDNYNFIVLSI